MLGFLLSDGSPSAEPVLVPVADGLTVLYGLNGAGKTRALGDIRAFWAGRWQGRAMALVRLAQPGSTYVDRLGGRFGESRDWANDWARHARTTERLWNDGESTDASLRTWVEHSIQFDPDTTDVTGPVEEERGRALVDEWHQQRLIVVMAGGSEDRPLWFSTPAVVTSPTTPQSNWAAELYERCSREEVFDDWHVIAFTPCGRLTNGQTVLSASPHGRVLQDDPEQVGAVHDWLIPLGLSLSESPQDVDSRTRDFLLARIAGDEVQVSDETVGPSDALTEVCTDLETAANGHYGSILLDAPRLQLNVRVTGLRAGVEWSVGGGHPAIDDLSTAQRRWALWAINEAIEDLTETSDRRVTRLSVVDEPEAALHRSAEAHMAAHITNSSATGGRALVVATHSPELLDSPTARLVEVSRREGRFHLSPLDSVDRDSLDRLGLSPSDLLRRQRGFLLVEGQHDADVLDILLGDELRRLRVEVLPLRGATELSAPKSRFLFQYTPAHLFVMLDNLNTDRVQRDWDTVKSVYLSEGLDAARKQLDAAFPKNKFGKGTEVKFLSEFLGATLEEGTWDRVTPYGLSKGDIIEYLPVRALVPGNKNWTQLRAAHDTAQAQGDKRNFKTWLQGRGANTTDKAIRDAARAMDSLPPDLARLRTTIDAITADRRTNAS